MAELKPVTEKDILELNVPEDGTSAEALLKNLVFTANYFQQLGYKAGQQEVIDNPSTYMDIEHGRGQ